MVARMVREAAEVVRAKLSEGQLGECFDIGVDDAKVMR